MATLAFPNPAATPAEPIHLPRNVEAEAALLGAMMIDNRLADDIVDRIEPQHFYEPLHGRVFAAIKTLRGSDMLATPVTLRPMFEADEGMKELGGPAYLASLTGSGAGLIGARQFAQQIYDLAMLRALVTVGRTLVDRALDTSEEVNPRAQIEAAEEELFKVAADGGAESSVKTFVQATTMAVKMAERALNSGGNLSGVTTGLDSVNAKIGGMHHSDLMILAGRPGMGKTSLATNIAYNVAAAYEPAQQADGSFKAANGGVVGFFSLEMSSEQLATRIISEQTEIPSSKIRRGDLTESDFHKLVAYTQENHKRPLFIDQTGGISIAQLSARARRLKRQRGLDLIIIDYIQLMTGSSRRGNENRVQEITEITTGLKALAKELGVPIIALSQLSRQVESRDDKRPQLSDLRESGSIEQDADVVMFVYRDEYYLKNKEPERGSPEHITWEDKMRDVQGKAEVIIGKQRHGPTGTVPMGFQGEFTRFFDLVEDSHLPERFE